MRCVSRIPAERLGIALGVAVAILAIMFILAFSYFTLMRGVGSGLEGADAHVRALAIAEAGTQAITARVFSGSWEGRWFRNGPDIQDKPISYGGGSYISVIQDTPGVPLSFDLWVRSTYRGTRRLLFYRISYEDSVFHGLVNPAIDFTATFAEGTGSASLTGGDLDPLTQKVNDLIGQRRQTSGNLGEARQRLAVKIDPLAILREVGAAAPKNGVLAVASAPVGISTVVPPPPVVPPPVGGQSTVKNVDRERIFNWLEKRGYDSDYLAALKGRANAQFAKIEQATRALKFLEAEIILRNLMQYLYGRTGAVNTQVNLEVARYRDAVQALETKAAAEGWTVEQLAAAKRELELEHRARRQQIYQTAWSETP
ncbi:MAG TPA: hypothetical protein PKO06_00845 [Candidatus Ozemobacteraceae bacterium]|nr:hypothetical protein [Candidatus Ozemobacteraceae bacterium]